MCTKILVKKGKLCNHLFCAISLEKRELLFGTIVTSKEKLLNCTLKKNAIFSFYRQKNTRQMHNFFNWAKSWKLILCWFCTSCEPKIVLPVLQIKIETIWRLQLVQLYRSTNNWSSDFGLIEEKTMDLSRNLLAVYNKYLIS